MEHGTHLIIMLNIIYYVENNSYTNSVTMSRVHPKAELYPKMYTEITRIFTFTFFPVYIVTVGILSDYPPVLIDM